VADAPPPPAAIRITRPYESEEEYLANELEMISKTSITLVGAQPRPQGVVLRFELVLGAGQVLVRGEGRVVGFKANAHRGVGGLTLRFTRIDARSKALLDKATAMRELRRPSSKPPKAPEEATAEAAPPPPPPSPEGALPAGPPAPPAQPPAPSSGPELPVALAFPPPGPPVAVVGSSSRADEAAAPPPPPVPPASAASPLPTDSSPARTAARPQDRNALLERLRSRAQALQPAAVQRILDQKGS
jgi:hypothetical protein